MLQTELVDKYQALWKEIGGNLVDLGSLVSAATEATQHAQVKGVLSDFGSLVNAKLSSYTRSVPKDTVVSGSDLALESASFDELISAISESIQTLTGRIEDLENQYRNLVQFLNRGPQSERKSAERIRLRLPAANILSPSPTKADPTVAEELNRTLASFVTRIREFDRTDGVTPTRQEIDRRHAPSL